MTRSISLFQAEIDDNFAWRYKEIQEIKTLAISSGGFRQNTLIRAGIALCYAHWEGFIKFSSQKYLEHVSAQRMRYGDLKLQFAVFGIKGRINNLSQSNQHRVGTEVLKFIQDNQTTRLRLRLKDAIDTESNLSSVVFDNIAFSLCIDTKKYDTKYHFIDENLVKARNQVAHGELYSLSLADFITLVDDILKLMRTYKSDIEKHAISKKYRRQSP